MKGVQRLAVEWTPTALLIRSVRSADVGPLGPLEPEPAKILQRGGGVFRPAASRIQIVITENVFASMLAGAVMGQPEGAGVSQMKIPGR
jgi:hypothetical protein